MKIKKWFDKYKKRKKAAIISDILLVALIIIMLIPSWRKEFGAVIVRLTMTSPDTEATVDRSLTTKDLSLAFTSPEGKIHQLRDLLDKPVLLTYWATWCHHCVAELPALHKLNKKAGNDINLVILVNEDLDKTRSYIQSKGFDLPVYRQQSRPGTLLSSKKIPASFLIDRNGNLVLKETGATQWGSGEFINYLQKL